MMSSLSSGKNNFDEKIGTDNNWRSMMWSGFVHFLGEGECVALMVEQDLTGSHHRSPKSQYIQKIKVEGLIILSLDLFSCISMKMLLLMFHPIRYLENQISKYLCIPLNSCWEPWSFDSGRVLEWPHMSDGHMLLVLGSWHFSPSLCVEPESLLWLKLSLGVV